MYTRAGVKQHLLHSLAAYHACCMRLGPSLPAPLACRVMARRCKVCLRPGLRAAYIAWLPSFPKRVLLRKTTVVSTRPAQQPHVSLCQHLAHPADQPLNGAPGAASLAVPAGSRRHGHLLDQGDVVPITLGIGHGYPLGNPAEAPAKLVGQRDTTRDRRVDELVRLIERFHADSASSFLASLLPCFSPCLLACLLACLLPSFLPFSLFPSFL